MAGRRPSLSPSWFEVVIPARRLARASKSSRWRRGEGTSGMAGLLETGKPPGAFVVWVARLNGCTSTWSFAASGHPDRNKTPDDLRRSHFWVAVTGCTNRRGRYEVDRAALGTVAPRLFEWGTPPLPTFFGGRITSSKASGRQGFANRFAASGKVETGAKVGAPSKSRPPFLRPGQKSRGPASREGSLAVVFNPFTAHEARGFLRTRSSWPCRGVTPPRRGLLVLRNARRLIRLGREHQARDAGGVLGAA